jgi:putative ABC transport system permease protein
MFVLKLVFKNATRHKLRTILTILGMAIAITAFGFIRTVVTAWSAGVSATSDNRMIVRHSVSFIFPLPMAYRDQLARVPGVSAVSFACWFQGQYKDPNDWKNFFPRMAVDAETFFDLYSEFVVPPAQFEVFKRERNACIVGAKIAREQGFKIGDVVTVEGDIYPGRWEFVVRGIYAGKDETTDETQLFFHYAYLDERLRQEAPARAGYVGWYVLRVASPGDMPAVARTIDDNNLNSRASTKTETEREFTQSFVSLSSAILNSLTAASYVIIAVILIVLANTILMSARERTVEYAILKTLGFSRLHIAGLVIGEAFLIAILGCAIGLALTFPSTAGLAKQFPTFFPVVNVEVLTILLATGVALLAAIVASLFPTVRALRTRIVEGLRAVG